MDVLAHGLWTNIMYKAIPPTRHNRQQTLWGVTFGILPDLASFTPMIVLHLYYFMIGQQVWPDSRSDFAGMPLAGLTQSLYDYTHSAVVWLVVVAAIWALRKRFPWVLLGWGLHIGIDIFSHSREFFPTPFLFPLSGQTVNGLEWSHPIFMAINYGLLLIIYFYVLPRIKHRGLSET